MHYFQPKLGFFVGDTMPFSHESTFHYFYLLDEGHHQGLGGMGGHQWAHASTRDLVHWEHHPLALPITADWETSICTGSVFYHEGIYHAFYATRKKDWSQHLSHAESSDGIHFTKTEPNPFLSPPERFLPNDFRDPFVFTGEDGRFHMLVTARLAEFPLHDRGGCLFHLTSSDLKSWKQEEPFLIPGGAGGDSVPECPDYFQWKGWYYLIIGSGLRTHYRMAKQPFGPWTRPLNDMLGNSLHAVMKTAPFGADRRIGTAWIGSRKDDKDSGAMLWGGSAFLRELVQNEDGTLGLKFVAEAIPATGAKPTPAFKALTPGVQNENDDVKIVAATGLEVGAFEDLPQDLRIRCTIYPEKGTRSFGLGLRGSGAYKTRYDLGIDCAWRTISLGSETILLEGDPFQPRRLDIIMKGDLIDVCLDDRQCLINRCPELKGDSLFLWCEDGSARFEEIEIGSLR